MSTKYNDAPMYAMMAYYEYPDRIILFNESVAQIQELMTDLGGGRFNHHAVRDVVACT